MDSFSFETERTLQVVIHNELIFFLMTVQNTGQRPVQQQYSFV